MLPVTSLIAAALAVLLIRLSLAVIRLRRVERVAFGHGGYDALERAIRAQGNFAEYAPWGLILVGCLEMNHAPRWLVLTLGLVFVVGRVIHAQGMNVPPPNFRLRVLGMQITLISLMILVAVNVAWTLLSLSWLRVALI